MTIAARLLAFTAAAVLALGGGWAIGTAVGPLDQPDPAPHDAPAHTTAPTTAPAHHGMSR